MMSMNTSKHYGRMDRWTEGNFGTGATTERFFAASSQRIVALETYLEFFRSATGT